MLTILKAGWWVCVYGGYSFPSFFLYLKFFHNKNFIFLKKSLHLHPNPGLISLFCPYITGTDTPNMREALLSPAICNPVSPNPWYIHHDKTSRCCLHEDSTPWPTTGLLSNSKAELATWKLWYITWDLLPAPWSAPQVGLGNHLEGSGEFAKLRDTLPPWEKL